MANPEHLEILKQGRAVWNKWRDKNRTITPDLRDAYLGDANLNKMDLSIVILRDATLRNATLRRTSLFRADLRSADLIGADLYKTNLARANLRKASLYRAGFIDANLRGADVNGAFVVSTVFADIDLSEVEGLENIKHYGPSEIGMRTIHRSQGKIPEVFLRGCGVPEDFIIYARSLSIKPIGFYSCFISYSSKDQEFADRLYADLQNKAVRCWFAPEDLKIGDRFRDRIDESIRLHDKLLLILSEHSVSSQWVGDEVEAAFERERREGRTVLFPIRIDDAAMDSDKAWAATIRRTRHVGDFTRWKDNDSYQKAFERLLRDLQAKA
jgi:uncharacterized protein YjbI with pentapeptide repeats